LFTAKYSFKKDAGCRDQDSRKKYRLEARFTKVNVKLSSSEDADVIMQVRMKET